MEYRHTLLKFIEEGREAEMMEWIHSQPDLQQLQILDEFKLLGIEIAEAAGDTDLKEELMNPEGVIGKYEEAVLNTQIASLQLEMAEKNLAEKVDDIEIRMQSVRDYMIDNLLNQPANVQDAQKMIDGLIQVEKDNGFYNPENWKRLPGL